MRVSLCLAGGGRAKVVVSTVLVSGAAIDAIIDDDRNKWGQKILGIPTQASIHPTVSIGQGAFLGIGSVAIVGMKVGKWSIIGAGGVVVRDVPDNVTAVGVPARVVRKLAT